MTFVTALMFAFNSVIFSTDIRKRVDEIGIMAALVGLALGVLLQQILMAVLYTMLPA